jgi:hypothetical protein
MTYDATKLYQGLYDVMNLDPESYGLTPESTEEEVEQAILKFLIMNTEEEQADLLYSKGFTREELELN